MNRPGTRVARSFAMLLVALLLAGPAQAAFTDEHDFDVPLHFQSLREPGDLTVLSGALTAGGETHGTMLVGNASFTITGLAQVCWDIESPDGCIESNDESLSLRVRPGAQAALSVPGNYTVGLGAAHAIVLLLDFGDDPRLGDLGFGPSLAAPLVDGTLTVTGIDPIPPVDPAARPTEEELHDRAGTLTGITAQSVIEVRNGTTIVTTLHGQATAGFTGAPVFGPVTVDTVALPMDGLSVAMVPAGPEAARRGLELARIDELRATLAEGEAAPSEGLTEVEALLQEVMNGALFRIPTDRSGRDAIAQSDLIRFSSLVIGPDLNATGAARLDVRQGEVMGASDLHGFWLLQLPWWGWMVWGLAIAALVARIVTKAPRKNERWDRFGWVGWATLLPVGLAVFVLWDREMRAVFGTSILSTDATGSGMAAVAGLQLTTLAVVIALLWWPMSMLVQNGLMLARQGRFMNLGLPIGLLLAFVLGASVLLSYLGLILPRVLGG